MCRIETVYCSVYACVYSFRLTLDADGDSRDAGKVNLGTWLFQGHVVPPNLLAFHFVEDVLLHCA